MTPPKLIIVVPCLDESETLPATDRVLRRALSEMQTEGLVSPASGVLYVDDGSRDATWDIISALAGGPVRGLRLSRHCGHQEALLAGIEEALADADAIVTIDADLQDDPGAIRSMVQLYLDGNDIVYGVRDNRSCDTVFKRVSARGFYRLMSKLGAGTVADHGDFRLLSARAAADLLEYRERNLYLRGIVPMLGYSQAKVTYTRRPRAAGRSKYPLARMADFAADGITSFSVRPVRMLFWIGLAFMLAALGMGVYVLVRHFTGETLEGWTSLMLSIWFCTGVLLMGLGLIGEYVGKIYIETKRRPRYRVSERV